MVATESQGEEVGRVSRARLTQRSGHRDKGLECSAATVLSIKDGDRHVAQGEKQCHPGV